MSIPPKRNGNSMCFGNMLRSKRIKKENINIVKEQSRHSIIQLQLANLRISVCGSNLKLCIEKQLLSVYGCMLLNQITSKLTLGKSDYQTLQSIQSIQSSVKFQSGQISETTFIFLDNKQNGSFLRVLSIKKVSKAIHIDFHDHP